MKGLVSTFLYTYSQILRPDQVIGCNSTKWSEKLPPLQDLCKQIVAYLLERLILRKYLNHPYILERSCRGWDWLDIWQFAQCRLWSPPHSFILFYYLFTNKLSQWQEFVMHILFSVADIFSRLLDTLTSTSPDITPWAQCVANILTSTR